MVSRESHSANSDGALFVISVAAELAGMHPQTLRQYDRLGLVTPQRTKGRGRRYTRTDIHKLREVQRLSQEEGINLAGVRHIMELTDQVSTLQEHILELHAQLQESSPSPRRVFTADSQGRINARNPHAPHAKASAEGSAVARPDHWFNALPPAIARLVLASLMEGQSWSRGQLPAQSRQITQQ